MNSNPAQPLTVLPAWLRAWERFWFTPADPTLLAMIRIGTGLIALYALFVYSFQLQDMMGPHAWLDLETRRELVRDRPMNPQHLLRATDATVGAAVPTNDVERQYIREYQAKFGDLPPPPFPETPAESEEIDQYRRQSGFDLRVYGLTPPRDEEQRAYLKRYTEAHFSPPSSYPKDAAEEKAIEEYIEREGYDPRRLYTRGLPVWSLWLHVTEPGPMAIVHGLAVVTALLFTIGLATRITSVLVWFFILNYIHRNPQMQFGMDTMMVILLLYLCIGPSGAALSVDRLVARWWSRAKPGVVRGWNRLLGRPALADAEIVPAVYTPQPQPSISANVALRLLQVHVCIIYLVSGLSKLQGNAWWEGTACWGTLANPEFAPFQLRIYDWFIRTLSSTALPLYVFLNIGTLFTLAFEIGYAFLIWRPATRWLFLAGALILHGLIGLLMGLKTFSLIMLVMNMVFLNRRETYWLLGWFALAQAPATSAPARAPVPAPEAVGAGATGLAAQR